MDLIDFCESHVSQEKLSIGMNNLDAATSKNRHIISLLRWDESIWWNSLENLYK